MIFTRPRYSSKTKRFLIVSVQLGVMHSDVGGGPRVVHSFLLQDQET